MKRPDKAGGKAVKPQRHMTLKRRKAAKVGSKPPTIDAAERIALLEHRLNEALEQQSATSVGELAMTRRTSEVALCCSSASFSLCSSSAILSAASIVGGLEPTFAALRRFNVM